MLREEQKKTKENVDGQRDRRSGEEKNGDFEAALELIEDRSGLGGISCSLIVSSAEVRLSLIHI